MARMASGGETQTVKITPKGKWPLLMAIPPLSLSTEEARRVLPAQYDRADAVINIQNSMLLLAALVQGRIDIFPAALDDRIHQPYRSRLCPLLPALQQLSGPSGILGVTLSGAGPSVLIFIDPTESIGFCKETVERIFARNGLSAELIPTTITDRGGNISLRMKRKKTGK